MARKSKSYWEKRSTELMLRLEKGTENTIESLIQVYEQATKNINKEIKDIFKNYAKDSGLKKETLLQLLSKKETDTHYKNLLEVINNHITDKDIKKKLLAQYNAPAYSYRISRYQALQDNINVELKKLADLEQNITQIRYVDTIKEGYYHNIYDIQKGLNLGFRFAQMNNKTIKMLLAENWIDKSNFSKRIWKNNEKLGNYLKTNLTADTMSGKSIQKISNELSNYMGVGLYNATTLVRTEVNHFANEAEMLSYEECGIEKYRFIATLDKVTCEHCGELDNKVFYLKDKAAGKNYPPIHPNDRCTTVAELDDNIIDGLTRRARDENNKSILVPQDMNYKEWKEKYVGEQKQNYIDITNQYKDKNKYSIEEQQYYIDKNGNRYEVDNRYVIMQPSTREREVANMLGNIHGGEIKIIPRVNKPEGIKTPDYMIENKSYDLKEISGNGKYVIQGNLKGKQNQAENFIIDITNSKLTEEEAIKQIQNIYKSKHYLWIDRLFLIKNKEFIRIYKRK